MLAVELQSQDHRDLLDAIDKLRSQGVSRMVDLPQVIVCGDQKAGKSSVLEAISHVPFPTKDTLCTRFATELILRRSNDVGIRATVIRADGSTSEDDVLFSSDDVTAEFCISGIIEQARARMGLYDRIQDATFSRDVLRIELSGPDQPHLTLVDLPGLFTAANKDQTDDDAAMVKQLVLHYMQQEGSIILAVVSAKSDFALQSVTKYTREFDPQGRRTLGLITKPDTLPTGSDSEKQYIQLARNEDVPLELGWHVLRNQGYADKKRSNTTYQIRDCAEAVFFRPSSVWAASLPPSQLGVAALRVRLSGVLKDHILADLPRLVKDVEGSIAACQRRLTQLGSGTPRSDLPQQRQYLIGVAHKFSSLVQAAIDGDYGRDVALFGRTTGEETYHLRLRAVVQNLMTLFAENMRTRGHAQTIEDVSRVSTKKDEDNKEDDDKDAASPGTPKRIARSAYLANVSTLMRCSRGRELPGLFNPLIVTTLFQEQCQPWVDLTGQYTLGAVGASRKAVDAFLKYVVVGKKEGDRSDKIGSDTDDVADRIMKTLITPALDGAKVTLKAKADELLEPHLSGHPITYNHYLTENVQKAQIERHRRQAKTLATRYFGKTSGTLVSNKESTFEVNINQFIKDFVAQHEPDMEKVACITATDYMEAYYKVALKKFVDNVSVLAVEQCLVQQLPLLFTPSTVGGLTDDEIRHLAAERPETVSARAAEEDKLRVLGQGLQELKQLGKHGVGKSDTGRLLTWYGKREPWGTD